MIPLNFYRDDEYVYYNNPNGITKKITIADFEAVMNGNGGDNTKLLTFSYSGETVTMTPTTSEVFFDFTFTDENGDEFNIDDYTFDFASITAIDVPNGGLTLRSFSLPLGNYGFAINLGNYTAESLEVGLNGISGQIVVINPKFVDTSS